GSSRSRGLGWVDLALVQDDEGDEEAVATPPPAALPDAEELEIVFQALEPLSLGPLPFVGNFQPTLDHLPASTVRGAVVTAALKRRGTRTDQSDDPAFRTLLLDPETCVRFGDAAPLADGSTPRPRIAPATARVGKYRGEEAGVTDTLVRDSVQRLLAEHGILCPVVDEVVDASGTRERAVRPPGRWLAGGAPERRVMTRVALDRRSARSKDGALYSVELLERGTFFAAPVHNAGPEARRLLEDAMAVDLRAGHGRGQGYGRLRIVEVREARNQPLRDRLDTFDTHVRNRIAAAETRHGVELEAGPDRFLAALLLTDLFPHEDDGKGSAEAAFHAALRLPESRLLHAEVRAGHRGGFDTTRHRPRPFRPVVRAGSVLLLAIPDLGESTVKHLERLERHGAGEARDRGFGALQFGDPIHRKGETP
ncbi:MAG: RAMP superfamily CRISPR-associated protein, partial [Acidobacteriota bacterium]